MNPHYLSLVDDGLEQLSSIINDPKRDVLVGERISGIELLKMQHREIDILFNRFFYMPISNMSNIIEAPLSDEDPPVESAQDVAREILHQLLLHDSIERRHFYPLIPEEDKELVAESVELHNLMRYLAKKIEHGGFNSEKLGAQMKVLHHLVEEHFREEEDQLFSKAEWLIALQDLEDMGDNILKESQNNRSSVH